MEEVGCRECPGPHGSLLYRIIGLFARASRALDLFTGTWVEYALRAHKVDN